MSRHIEFFLEMMAAERGASPRTLEAYGRDLDDFSGFVKGDAAQASSDDLRGYLARMKKQALAPRTAAPRSSGETSRLT